MGGNSTLSHNGKQLSEANKKRSINHKFSADKMLGRPDIVIDDNFVLTKPPAATLLNQTPNKYFIAYFQLRKNL